MQLYSQETKTGNHPNVYGQMNEQIVMYPCNGILFGNKKE